MTHTSNVKLEKLTAGDFREHLETDFFVSLGNDADSLRLRLVEVNELRGGGPRREPFSLIFSGPHDVYLPQQIYTLRHNVMGVLDIFIVPIRPDERGARLQAIFN